MPAPPATMWSSAAQCRGGFRKKFSDLPPSTVQKRGGGAYRGEKLISENRVANCTLPCWTLSGVGYGRAQHRHLPNRRYGPTQCKTDASDAHGGRARGRAHEEVAAPILQQPRLSETDAMNGDSGPHPRTPRPSPMRQEVGTSVVRRGNPRCGDANRRTAVVRLRTACASAAHAAGPVLGLSHFSPPWSICAPRRCARADANVACACCVCGRVGVFFSVYARVHVRYHVCVHASSCHGHVFAHASMRVRVSHFRSPLPSQMQRKLRNYRRTSQSCPVQARCR